MKKILLFMSIAILPTLTLAAEPTKRWKIYWQGPFVYSKKANKEIKDNTNFADIMGFDLITAKPLNPAENGSDYSVEIYNQNLKRMQDADFMVADMTSFRGVSADASTAFAMGYMYGLGKPVLAYTGDTKRFTDRVIAELERKSNKPVETADGRLRDAISGDSLETFDMADNLMLAGAVDVSYSQLGITDFYETSLPKSFKDVLYDARSISSIAGNKKITFDPCSLQAIPNLPRTIPGRKKVLLNGPDVFRPEAKLLGLGKNIFIDQFSQNGVQPFTGVFPFDVAVIRDPKESNYHFGVRIFQKDIGNMCASDISTANIIPYHGPSMDVGTAFEMGFMAALGKSVYTYSNSKDSYEERVLHFYLGALQDQSGLRDPKGYLVETGVSDTFMIEGAIRQKGSSPTSGLEGALSMAFKDLK